MMHRAFTIVELLVVTIIISLLALIAIPAFNAIIHDSERSLAEEALQTAFRTARAAALKSAGDQDTALVFHYVRTPDGGRTTMVVCRRAGLMEDFDSANPVSLPGVNDQVKLREVFVPVPDVDPIQLPKGWMVRGYAKLGTISPPLNYGWYEPGDGARRYDPNIGNWVFPETDFYDVDEPVDGEHRQTFLVRFRAGSGEVTSAPFSEILVLSPRPSQENSVLGPGDQHLNVADAEDDFRVVRAILNLPMVGGTPRVRLLGSRSSDTILARPVNQVALYNEGELAAALGVRVDRETGCLYVGGVNYPEYRPGVNQNRINGWIEGDTNFNGQITAAGNDPDAPLARVYTIDRATAFLTRMEVLQ